MEQLVRPARAPDCAELALLEREAREALVHQRGGPQHLAEQPPVDDWVTLVGRPDRAVFVATIDGLVFGYLELELLPQAAVVRQVYVHPEARQLGFGDEMLAASLQRARDHGCSVLEGSALPGDRDTKNLYERAGITARKIIVSAPLRP